MNKNIIFLLPLLLLSSCGSNKTSSSSLTSTSQSLQASSLSEVSSTSTSSSTFNSTSINHPYSEELEPYMFLELDNGVYVEQIHYLSEIKNGNTASSYVMYLDYEVTNEKYAYQKYAPVIYENEDSLNKIARKRLYEASEYTSKNGYLNRNYLSLSNKIETQIVKDEYSLKIDYQESGYVNMFSLLDSSYFVKSGNLSFNLDLSKIDELKAKTISYNIHGKKLPTLTSFTLFTDGYHISGYEASYEYFSASQILDYKFEATIVSRGNNAKTNSKFLAPISGEEDLTLSEINEKLQKDSYAETTIIYSLDDSGNKKYIDEYFIERDKDVILYNESYYYYRDEEEYLFNVREISDKGYFDNEAPISLLYNETHLGFSSLVLDKTSSQEYSYSKGKSKCQYLDLSNYTFLYSGEVNEATFNINKSEITITSKVTLNKNNFEFVTRITNIGNINHPFSKEDINKDGSNLTFSDLFYDLPNLATLQEYVGGEELLNHIPTLGGYHNYPGVEIGLDPTDDIMVQFTYYLIDLFECDFDGCGSISEYDYSIFLAYIDDLIDNYAAKYDPSFFEVTKGDNRSYTAVSKDTFIKNEITHRLEIEFYIGHYDYQFYLIINAVFKPIRHAVTFDFMCNEIPNKTLMIKEGDVPEVYVTNREGYAFLGWYKDSRLSISANPLPRIYTPTTFYAKWEARDDVKITFDYNYQGSPSAYSITVPYSHILSDIPEPTRSGYTFYAWAIDASGSAPALFYSEPVTSSMRVYALWIKN